MRSARVTASARVVGKCTLRPLPALPRRHRRTESAPRRRRCRAFDEDADRDALNQFCPVPLDQQPIHELKELQVCLRFLPGPEREDSQDILLFDWATLPFPEFLKKLALLWSGFCVISCPVSAATFDPKIDPVPFFVAASSGSLFVVMVVVFRLFLGWSHVGRRLQSETIEYEESGWYDGQVWTKTEECLNRDRLARSFTVNPALKQIKTTLWTVCGSFLSCLLLLAVIEPTHPLPPQTIDGLSHTCHFYAPMGHLRVVGMYTRAQTKDGFDYWDRTRKFEPWSLEDAPIGDLNH